MFVVKLFQCTLAGRFGLNKEFRALEGAAAGSSEDQGSYCQTLVRCCEEVWRRMSSPYATVLGLPRDLQKKGDASFRRWKVGFRGPSYGIWNRLRFYQSEGPYATVLGLQCILQNQGDASFRRWKVHFFSVQAPSIIGKFFKPKLPKRRALPPIKPEWSADASFRH